MRALTTEKLADLAVDILSLNQTETERLVEAFIATDKKATETLYFLLGVGLTEEDRGKKENEKTSN